MPTLLIDNTTTNYADSTAAAAAISDQAATGCYAEGRSQSGATRTTFTSSFSAGTLSVDSSYTAVGDGAQDRILSRVYLTATDGISVVYNITTDGLGGCQVELFKDDGSTLVDSATGTSPFSGTFAPTVPSDGYYYIRATNGGLGATSTSISISCTGGSSFLPCSVRAGYDDGSGGTAYVLCA